MYNEKKQKLYRIRNQSHMPRVGIPVKPIGWIQIQKGQGLVAAGDLSFFVRAKIHHRTEEQSSKWDLDSFF